VFGRIRPARSHSPRDLERLSAVLGASVDRFGRELGRHRSHRKARQSRGSHLPARLSSLPSGRRPGFKARWHPLRLPQDYRRGVAPTVLSRNRDMNGRPPFALEVEARAEGLGARIRRQLRRLRAFLARTRDRFRWGRSSRPIGRRLRPTRAGIITAPSAGGGRILTALVLVTTVGLGLDVLNPRQAAAVDVPPSVMVTALNSVALDARIDELAQAIAVAEGYHALGQHDGRTLPYLLNNPGALKKPALGAAELPTWKDTGIVWFPTADMGWDALRHQVRLMLTGTSGIYEHSDSLMSVGGKYAEGDMNWGVNVATKLGVPPARTLAELALPD
jgi:hypothetical protein